MINAVVKQIPQNIKQVGDFRLITKIKRADIKSLDGSKFWRAPENAERYDYAQIGKKSDENFSKEVISFYDSWGKLISRIFRENGKNTKMRKYQYACLRNKKTLTDFIFDSSRITENVNDAAFNLGGRWKKVSEETHWINQLFGLKKEGKTPIAFRTRHVDYDVNTDSINSITLTQYPATHSGKHSKKFITGKFQETPDGIKLLEAVYSKNLNLDFTDKYLTYRFFDLFSPEGLTIFTKGLLKNKGLAPLNIIVEPNSLFVHYKDLACFNSEFGKIYFAKKLLKGYDLFDIVDTAAHEVEHAMQHALIGRRGKGNTKYERDALRLLGELTDPKEQQEAIHYAIANEEYSGSGDKYINNLLEVKAREAGRKAVDDFQLPAENFDFFEQFN